MLGSYAKSWVLAKFWIDLNFSYECQRIEFWIMNIFWIDLNLSCEWQMVEFGIMYMSIQIFYCLCARGWIIQALFSLGYWLIPLLLVDPCGGLILVPKISVRLVLWNWVWVGSVSPQNQHMSTLFTHSDIGSGNRLIMTLLTAHKSSTTEPLLQCSCWGLNNQWNWV